MTRREYLYLHCSAFMAMLWAACKPEEKANGPVIVTPVKKLTLTKVLPEKAVAGQLLEIFWESENIESLSVLIKIGLNDWEIAADAIDSKIGNYALRLPQTFEKDVTISIKIVGDGLEAIKDNIPTEYTIPLPKIIEILKIEPAEAIAGEKLTVFFKADNLNTLWVELRNQWGGLLETVEVEATKGFYEFLLPAKFEVDELLSFKLVSDPIHVLSGNISTFNVLLIDTDSYPDLQTLNTFQKVVTQGGDIWLKRVGPDKMLAYSGRCTHSGCGIDFVKADSLFNCSCHGSKFALDGTVLNGPASLPLNQFRCIRISNETFKLIY